MKTLAVNNQWRVTKLWAGDDVYIIGGGPSLKSLDVRRLWNKGRVIAVNCAYMLGNWFEAVYWGDHRWLRNYGEGLKYFNGLKVTTSDDGMNVPGVLYVMRSNEPGISRDPGAIRFNNSSGAGAINLATLLGAGRIFLLGFDMRKEEDGTRNYHSLYPRDNSDERSPYWQFLQPFPRIALDLVELGVECINVTPYIEGKPFSSLKDFPFMDMRLL